MHFLRSFLPGLFCVAVAASVTAQTQVPLPVHHTCTVQTGASNPPILHTQSEIDELYNATLAKAKTQEPGPVTVDTIVDSELNLDDRKTALVYAQGLVDTFPKSSEAYVELGEVKMRLGYVDETIDLVNRAIRLDTCNPWAHYEAALYLVLDGMYDQARKQIKTAHALLPDNRMVTREWERLNPPAQTPEQEAASLKEKLAGTDLNDREKKSTTLEVQYLETLQHGDCRLSEPVKEAEIHMVPMAYGPINTPRDIYGAGLEVAFNDKKRRMLLDTGASGLLLSHSAASALGLTAEMHVKVGGFGDQGAAKSFLTHVDDIRIGPLEFKNCMVEVMEQDRGFGDGLIGSDVFKDYLVTLDFPERLLKLAPLPPRPSDGTEPTQTNLNTTAGQTEDLLGYRHDRYVAPEMKAWDEVFRSGHDLIVPTVIGNAPIKLFVLDSGSSGGLISPEAARLVTGVSDNSDAHSVHGLSGRVEKVEEADSVWIAFAGVKQKTQSMTTIDLTHNSQRAGVEISGYIGFPTLRQVTLAIDYRDNLIHVTYDPKHDGYH